VTEGSRKGRMGVCNSGGHSLRGPYSKNGTRVEGEEMMTS